MLKIQYHSKLKKDYKRIIKRGYSQEDFQTVLNILVSGNPLPDKYRDHSLSGNYAGFRECHTGC